MMLLKALELGHPETMLEVIRLHAELAYHPSVKVLDAYIAFFKNATYDKFQLFFHSLKGNFFLIRPHSLHITAIELASKNNDSKGVL